MADVLYLVKANRVREYHLQNLAIVAAPDGASFEISYAQRWVEPGLDVAPGQGCALVIADPPYRHYHPLRWGVVDRATFADKRLRLTVRMGPFIVDGERLTVEWDAAAQIDAERSDGEKTRPYLAFREPNHGMRNPHGPEEQEEAWRRAVDGLKANDYFSGCSLARVGALTRADGVAIGAGQAVPVGTNVRIPLELHSIGRSETDLEVALEVEPAGALELVGDASVPTTGTGEIEALVVAPGAVRARLHLLPDALRSSRPVVELSAVAAEVEPADAGSVASAGGVRRLIERLQRDADISDDDWIALYEDFFVPWGGHDPDVVAHYAECLLATGRFGALEAVLSVVDPRPPRLDLLLLLAAIHNGTAGDYLGLLTRVDFDDVGHFGLLLDALDEAAGGALPSILEPLHRDVLGDDRRLELAELVLPRVSSDEIATALIEDVAHADAELAVGHMIDRWPDPASMHAPALDLLVALGVPESQLAPYVRHWLAAMSDSRRWDDLLAAMPAARAALPDADRPAALAASAADLLASGDDDIARAGFDLACDVAREACHTGQLDTASSLADVLRDNLMVSATREQRLAAQALIDIIEQSLEHSRLRTRGSQLP